MKILFIEDDDEKRKKINSFLQETFSELEIKNKKSYNSGLLELVLKKSYTLVLMDMSMPNFDITTDDPEGGSPESFAGRELLNQMKFRNITYPTIIITQFDSFGEHIEKLSLEELNEELKNKFTPTYRETVYYHSSESNWKTQLKEEIEKILKETDDKNIDN